MVKVIKVPRKTGRLGKAVAFAEEKINKEGKKVVLVSDEVDIYEIASRVVDDNSELRCVSTKREHVQEKISSLCFVYDVVVAHLVKGHNLENFQTKTELYIFECE